MLLRTHKPQTPPRRERRNKCRPVDPKPPFKLPEIRAIWIRPEIEHRVRKLAMFNCAIDGKVRGCDLARLKISDFMHGHHAVSRVLVFRHKTQQPLRYVLTGQTRDAVESWMNKAAMVRWSDGLVHPS